MDSASVLQVAKYPTLVHVFGIEFNFITFNFQKHISFIEKDTQEYLLLIQKHRI